MNVVMTIAGSDSGGGAGIQADVKTFEAHGIFGTTVITSITAQNTVGVRSVFEVPIDAVQAQLEAVFDDFDIAAIKIGMLANSATIQLVADSLRERAVNIPIVLDPVMVATSGDELLRSEAVEILCRDLLPLATLITPNIDEAAILARERPTTIDDMRRIATVIYRFGPKAVLLKGGHLSPQRNTESFQLELTDILYDGHHYHHFLTPWIDTTNTHGTGCTLSSAIAANLANGTSLIDAIDRAQRYVHRAILNAPGLGHGHGPLLHGG